MEIKAILFPTDISEGSFEAMPYAVDLARRYNAKLYIIHVIYDPIEADVWLMPNIPMDKILEDLENNAKAELEKHFATGLEGLTNYETFILRGTPPEVIKRFAEEHGVGMIVMPTHGRKGIDRLIFGSTTLKVLKIAACPVLTVRIH